MKKKFLPTIPKFLSALVLTVAVFLAASSPSAFAVDGTWTKTTGGNSPWETAGNWSGSNIANGAGSIANFSTVNITANTTVQLLTTNRTVGQLLVGDTDGSNSYSFTGGGGILTFDNNGSGAVLTITSGNQNNLTFNANLPVLLADDLMITNNSSATPFLNFSGDVSASTAGLKTLTVGPSVNRTNLGGVISDGAGQVAVVFNHGTLASGNPLLSGSNTFTGGITFQSGLVSIGTTGAAALGAGTVTFDGGTLTSNSSQTSTVTNATTIGAGGGTIRVGSSSEYTWSGNISGVGGLTAAGNNAAALLLLSGSNSYAGGTTLTQGILRAGSANGFVNNTAYTVDGGTLDLNGFNLIMSSFSGTGGAVTLGSAQLTVDQSATTTYAGGISGAGSLVKSGAGALILTGDSSHTGGSTISSGTLQVGNGGTTGSVAGNILNNSSSLVFNRSNAIAHSGTVSGSGSLTQAGSNTLTLSGSNAYTGGTLITAGTVNISDDANLGATSSGVTLSNNAALTVSTATLLDSARTVTIDSTGGTLDASSFFNIDGVVAGDGLLTKTGGSVLSFNNAANTISGGIQVNDGTLRVRRGDGSLGATANSVTLANGTAFRVDHLPDAPSIFNAARTMTLTSGTVTVDAEDPLEWQGTITGGGGLIVNNSGSSTATFSGTGSYGGTTVVSNGTLLINGDFSAVGGGFTVDVGATLGGSGVIGSAVSVNGTLAPGNSIEEIDVASLSITSTGTLDMELGVDTGTPVSDRVNVTGGSITLDGGANLALTLFTGLDDPVEDDTFWLTDNAGATAITGVFTSLNGVATTLNEGSIFSWNSQSWKITYLADFGTSSFTGGNDLALQVVPEPSTVLLAGLGLAFVLYRTRRKMAQNS